MGASGMEQLHKIAAVIFVAQVGNATELGNAGVVTGIQLCVLLTRKGTTWVALVTSKLVPCVTRAR